MRDAHWPEGAFAAEFADEEQFIAAVGALREQGYSKIETYTPYPVPKTDVALPNTPSPLALIVFVAGICGALVSYWIQWYTNAVSYPLNIGGRPAHAAPAFFIPSFEGTVLAASLAAFVGLFALLRLPRPWHPIFEAEGFDDASIDRFWIAIDLTDRRGDPAMIPRTLAALQPVRVVAVPGDA